MLDQQFLNNAQEVLINQVTPNPSLVKVANGLLAQQLSDVGPVVPEEVLNQILSLVIKSDTTYSAKGSRNGKAAGSKHLKEEKKRDRGREQQSVASDRLLKIFGPMVDRGPGQTQCCQAIVFVTANGDKFGRQCKRKADAEGADTALCKQHNCFRPRMRYVDGQAPEGIVLQTGNPPKPQSTIAAIFTDALQTLQEHRAHDRRTLDRFQTVHRRSLRTHRNAITEQVRIGVSRLTDFLVTEDEEQAEDSLDGGDEGEDSNCDEDAR
jgi:hypothetical protein